MSNHFVELAKEDVGKHIEKKGRFNYLSWAWAVDRLSRQHPDAIIEHTKFPDENGNLVLPYLKTECGYFVEVSVTVNGIKRTQIHPVLDNNNRPVKEPNAFQINTSIQRCLAKSIALHGLGLYIYQGEDLPTDDSNDAENTSSNKKESTKPSGKTARDIAIEKAKEKSKEKSATAKGDSKEESKQDDSPPFDTEEGTEDVEPIKDAQVKAIGNMIKILSRKKGTPEEDTLTGLLSKYGKEDVKELSSDEARSVISDINAEMRKK